MNYNVEIPEVIILPYYDSNSRSYVEKKFTKDMPSWNEAVKRWLFRKHGIVLENNEDEKEKAATTPDSIAQTIAERTNNKAVNAELIKTAFLEPWLKTTFGSPESNQLQKVASRTFGFPDPPGMKELDINWKLLYPMGEMYNITQDYLKQRGFSEFQTVPVYRPYLPSEARTKQWQKGDEVRIRLLPLTSWTLDIREATKVAQFLGSPGSPALVLKTFIPIKSIVSTPNTGVGMPGTAEVVLAGGEYEARVENRYG